MRPSREQARIKLHRQARINLLATPHDNPIVKNITFKSQSRLKMTGLIRHFAHVPSSLMLTFHPKLIIDTVFILQGDSHIFQFQPPQPLNFLQSRSQPPQSLKHFFLRVQAKWSPNIGWLTPIRYKNTSWKCKDTLIEGPGTNHYIRIPFIKFHSIRFLVQN